MKFQLIVACTKEGGIAFQNKIPWHLPPDLKRFREITSCTKKNTYRNAVIMGRKTWETFQSPLKNRLNIVISNTLTPSITKDLWFAPSLQDALNELNKERPNYKIEHVFLIGGQRIYEEGIKHPECCGVYLTEVKYDGQCDTFFPIHELSRYNNIYSSNWLIENGVEYQYRNYIQLN